MSKLLSNIKISTKILGGFGIVLLLLLIVGYVGLHGMSGTVERVIRAEDLNRMVKLMQRVHQYEQNFIIHGEKQDVDNVSEAVADLVKQATESKEKFSLAAEKEKMDEIHERANAYRTAFNEYVDTENEKKRLMESMQTEASDAIGKLEEISDNQKEQLVDILLDLSGAQHKTWALTTLMNKLGQRVANADDANQMIKWFLDARKSEKELIISGDQKNFDVVRELMEKIMDLGADLKKGLENPEAIDRVEMALDALSVYYEVFTKFVGKIDN